MSVTKKISYNFFLTWDFQQVFRKSIVIYCLKFLLFDTSFWLRFCSKLDIGLPQFLWQHRIRLKALKYKKKMWILFAKVRKVPKGYWADFPFHTLNDNDVKWVLLKGFWRLLFKTCLNKNRTWLEIMLKDVRRKNQKLLMATRTFFPWNKCQIQYIWQNTYLKKLQGTQNFMLLLGKSRNFEFVEFVQIGY